MHVTCKHTIFIGGCVCDPAWLMPKVTCSALSTAWFQRCSIRCVMLPAGPGTASWYWVSGQQCRGKLALLRVGGSVLLQVADRLRHFAPAQVGEDELPEAPIHKQAVELAEAAVNPRTLCRMDPTWHPWF